MLFLLANCSKIFSLWVNSVIKLFVNWCNCFNGRRTGEMQLFFSSLSSFSTVTNHCLWLTGLYVLGFFNEVFYYVFLFVCRDAKCGKIQCQGGANRPVIGTNAVSIETNIPLQEGGRILCRGTHVYLGDDMPDPGLVLSGTKCGDGTVSGQFIMKRQSVRLYLIILK